MSGQGCEISGEFAKNVSQEYFVYPQTLCEAVTAFLGLNPATVTAGAAYHPGEEGYYEAFLKDHRGAQAVFVSEDDLNDLKTLLTEEGDKETLRIVEKGLKRIDECRNYVMEQNAAVAAQDVSHAVAPRVAAQAIGNP